MVVRRCGAVRSVLECACVPVVRWCCAPSRIGTIPDCNLGSAVQGTGRRGLLPGACLHVATVDGPNGSNRAWRPGWETGVASSLSLCCACAVLGYAGWVDVLCGPGGMKRAGPEFTGSPLFIRGGGGAFSCKSHLPIPSHHRAAQHDAAQRKGMARQQQQQQVRCRQESGRRNGTTRRMAWGRVSKACVPPHIHRRITMSGLLIDAAPPDPRDYTACNPYTKAGRRHDTIRRLTDCSNHCHYHCRLPTRDPP